MVVVVVVVSTYAHTHIHLASRQASCWFILGAYTSSRRARKLSLAMECFSLTHPILWQQQLFGSCCTYAHLHQQTEQGKTRNACCCRLPTKTNQGEGHRCRLDHFFSMHGHLLYESELAAMPPHPVLAYVRSFVLQGSQLAIELAGVEKKRK